LNIGSSFQRQRQLGEGQRKEYPPHSTKASGPHTHIDECDGRDDLR
jgi:hypothetical protein